MAIEKRQLALDQLLEALVEMIVVERSLLAGENILRILPLKLSLPLTVCVIQLGALFSRFVERQLDFDGGPIFREDQLFQGDDGFVQRRKTMAVCANRVAIVSYHRG